MNNDRRIFKWFADRGEKVVAFTWRNRRIFGIVQVVSGLLLCIGAFLKDINKPDFLMALAGLLFMIFAFPIWNLDEQ